ncbi:hypothetical protein [Sphaerimonospora mesophila]|uniref:hypothetical protein n=1 Tax=Sphaerimonospora mesophila TaxID=37483 RepID=UPI0006E17179
MYTIPATRTPTPADFAEVIEGATYSIRLTYERWPIGHPLHPIVPGFLARTLAEDIVIGNHVGFVEADVRAVIAKAFTTAGVGADIASVVADAVCDDRIVD